MKLNRIGLVLASLCIAASNAAAQDVHRVAWSKIETGPWTLTPIYSETVEGSPEVKNFLALADGSTVIGSNLIAVWYQRTANGWTAKSWETADPREAIKSVKAALNIPDSDDDRWEVAGLGSTGSTAGAAKEYVKGVLIDDPLAALVASAPDRDEIVDFLASVGYKAADVPVEKGDGCTTDAKLDGMAAAMNETLKGDEETAVSRSMAAWIASGSAGCGIGAVAVEIVTLPPKPITPWAPPVYGCLTEFNWLVPECWSTCQKWTETRTVVQKRTRARFNPAPPPTYLYCDQTNTGIETRTTECCVIGCITITTPTVTPCPTIPPGTTPAIGTGCPAGSTTSTTTSFTGAGWIPACAF